ncbi:MAG TPA: hypothetical protein VN914_08730 [Polyangia bacterium]|nr:hypothetical protein [Polyangia bacterium]
MTSARPPLVLAIGALASQAALALLIWTDHLGWFVPANQPFTGPPALKMYALPVIQLVCGLSFLLGGAAVPLAAVRLWRAESDRQRMLALLALVLGILALPAAVALLVVGTVAATPWSFG